jgi:ABC transport system ATP-binding/permease protein
VVESVPAAAARPVAASGDSRAAKKELARLERSLAKLDEQAKRLHGEMAAQSTDYTKITTLDEQLRGISAERERIEEAWMLAAEAADA